MKILTMRRAVLVCQAAFIALAALSLAACKTTSSNSSSSLLSSDSDQSAPKISNATAQETTQWGNKWQVNKGDPATTLQYVARLRSIGSNDKALSVLQDANKENPNSTVLRAEYGKQLARAGKYEEASVILQPAASAPDAGWQVNSTQGMVFDNLGRHGDAQAAYTVALQKSPQQIAVLNNLGLSQAQSGNLKGAEETLRRAYNMPEGKNNPKVRQNLALVVGLQGRYDEAKNIAQKDLPPHIVEANMSYLRKMMSQPNTWQKLSNMDSTEG